MLKTARQALAILIAAAAFAGILSLRAFAQGLPKNNLPAGSAKPGEIVARFPLSMTADDVARAADGAGCVVAQPIQFSPGYYLLKLKTTRVAPRPLTRDYPPPTDEVKTAVAKLAATAGVLANPNYLFHVNGFSPAAARGRRADTPTSFTPNDPLYPRQVWHMSMINMPLAWAIQSNQIGRAVRVAVSDTGLDVTHPEFPAVRVVDPQNVTVTPATTDVTDAVGHGTHVAGTVAATTNNAVGVTGVAGLSNGGVNIQIMPVKTLDDTGVGSLASGIAAVNYAIQRKADVVNMSWGGEGGDVSTLQAVVEQAIAGGIVVVAAAGNDASTAGDFWPGSFPGVIRVSAVGTDRKLTVYSNFGPGVAIAAPGGDGINGPASDVLSTFPLAGAADDPGNTTGYSALAGTSMASPHVAGACALLVAAGVKPSEIRTAIQSTAQQLDETPVLDPNGFSKYGAGLLDVYAALKVYLAPSFEARFVGPLDLGPTYFTRLKPFNVEVRGVNAAPPVGGVTLEIQSATIPGSVVRTLVDGTDFTIPRSIPDGQSPATWISVQIPDPAKTTVDLAAGRYKAVLKASGTELATQFFEVVARIQPLGRTMFATPFKVRQADPNLYPNAAAQPERTVLGDAAVFSLARYNPLRSASDLDYAIWRSSGSPQDNLASFNPTSSSGLPFSYETTDPNTSIAPVGLGYWLDLDRPVTVNPVGDLATNAVAIRLFAANGGWNMIGAPFVAPAAWGTLSVQANGVTLTLEKAIEQNIISSALIGYSGGDYVYNIFPSGQMDPFNGYWVRVFQDCTLIVAPSGTTRRVNAPVSSGARSGLPKIDGWRARIIATVGGDRDGQNYFGQARGASEEADRYDVPKPPSGGGHGYVRFTTPAGDGRAVSNAFDMRPLEENRKAEWTAAVSTDRTNADVVISWDGLGGVPHRSHLILTDTATGKTVDMRSRSSYTYHSGEAGSTRLLKVTLAPGLSAGPLTITNVSVVSGRGVAESGLAVRFNTTADADVVGVVKALNGTVVNNLSGAGRATAAGGTTLRWDGRSRAGALVPPGPYLVEITARTSDGQTAKFTQPVQNLR